MKNSYEYDKLPTKHKNGACTHSSFQLNYYKNKFLDEKKCINYRDIPRPKWKQRY